MPLSVIFFRIAASCCLLWCFDEKDVLSLKRIEGIEYVVPYSVKTVQVQSKGKSEIADIRGTTENDSIISHVEMDQGIFFDRKDVEKKSKVVVLGQTIAEKLFQSSIVHLKETGELDLSVLHGDGTNAIAKKGAKVSDIRVTNIKKA